MTFEEFIMQAREMNASDIHLTVGAPTVVRVNGELRKYTELSDQVVNRTILSILSAEQEKMLTEGKDIDFSFELKNGARQRVNVFRQSGKLAACIRLLNAEIPTLEELKMPPVLLEFAKKRRGLVLVTGPTGAGKSTTLAALMEYINKTRRLPRHHHRGPDRVPLQAGEGDYPSERARARRSVVPRGASQRAA